MSDTARAAQEYPAPGSAVPGAPPALKRALTPADGVQMGAQQSSPGLSVAVSGAPGAAGGSRYTAAAALMGVAVGLELAGLLSGVLGTPRRSKTLT
jgi:hypothetical protein